MAHLLRIVCAIYTANAIDLAKMNATEHLNAMQKHIRTNPIN